METKKPNILQDFRQTLLALRDLFAAVDPYHGQNEAFTSACQQARLMLKKHNALPR